MTSKARKDHQDTAAAPDAAEEGAPDVSEVTPPSTARPVPRPPSFGISQGTADELARTGQATDPFTGKLLTDEDRLAELDREARKRGETPPRRHTETGR